MWGGVGSARERGGGGGCYPQNTKNLIIYLIYVFKF